MPNIGARISASPHMPRFRYAMPHEAQRRRYCRRQDGRYDAYRFETRARERSCQRALAQANAQQMARFSTFLFEGRAIYLLRYPWRRQMMPGQAFHFREVLVKPISRLARPKVRGSRPSRHAYAFYYFSARR